MHCKNCNISLRTDYSFCPDCGAKVIRNRITVKSLIFDFFERYFNLDNTFFKTQWHMIIKPQEVCGGYINGLRKKYLNPVSMLAISLTTSGLILFLMKKVAWEQIDFSGINYVKSGIEDNFTEKIMSLIMEYNSLLYFLYIPVVAFASYGIFNKKRYNYPEHIISAIYTLTSFSIISIVYSVTVLLVNPQWYIDTALTYVFIMVLFCLYVAYRNSKSSIASLFWRAPLFFLIFFIGYLGISFLSLIILLVTGDISPEDFVPRK